MRPFASSNNHKKCDTYDCNLIHFMREFVDEAYMNNSTIYCSWELCQSSSLGACVNENIYDGDLDGNEISVWSDVIFFTAVEDVDRSKKHL